MRPSIASLLAGLLLAIPAWGKPPAANSVPAFKVTSPDFAVGKEIPARFTCAGQDVSPSLEIAGVPEGAKSLVLIVEDPDAPAGTFTHWVVWNIKPETKKIGAGSAPARAEQGTNDFGKIGYGGPCPPAGTHHYYFQVSALDIATLSVAKGAKRADVDAAINGHVLGRGTLMAIATKR